jgi:hypothetical protein
MNTTICINLSGMMFLEFFMWEQVCYPTVSDGKIKLAVNMCNPKRRHR